MFSRLVLLIFGVLMIFTTGCGLLFQTVVGWHSQEKATKSETKVVEVTSNPPGAEVIRRTPDGVETTLGSAPLADPVPYQIETTVERPSVWGLVVGSLIEGGVAAAAIAAGAGSSDASAQALGVTLGASTIVFLTIPELIVALVHGLSGESVVQRKTVGGSKQYLYAGRLSGYPDALALVTVPDQARAQLVLDPRAQGASNATAKTGGSTPSSSPAAGSSNAKPTQVSTTAPATTTPTPATIGATGAKPGATWVIAVMDVEDLNAQSRDKAIDPGLVKNLGDQLRIFVAQRGVRTVDRGAQEKMIGEQISAMKKESYKTCYDDSCQVELGKALAASHILRSRITRFGKRCVLNAELIDLKSEVTMAASSSQGDCEAEGFLTMSENVATNLIAK
jgi:hypothetical protein